MTEHAETSIIYIIIIIADIKLSFLNFSPFFSLFLVSARSKRIIIFY